MVKHRVPNIVRGGVALPLNKTNYYLVRGRKHEQGGIDIGKNPRTGLEVEDGEVVHVNDKELRVFSAEPILGGVSPSQLVVRGVNPDKVFAAQERFKQVNGIKDDGTKAKLGKRKYIGSNEKTTEKQNADVRRQYWNYDTKLAQVVSDLSSEYGIDPRLAIARLNREGLIDSAIRLNNRIVQGEQYDGEELYNKSILDVSEENQPYANFGLDTIFDRYTKGYTKTNRPIYIERAPVDNEKENVNTGYTNNMYDTMELFIAELAARQNEVKKKYPNLSNDELMMATNANFNATTKYFKNLMDSGEYKNKYKIENDVKGINIPIAKKYKQKENNVVIDEQDKLLDGSHDFYMHHSMEVDPELTVINNKSYDPEFILKNEPLLNKARINYYNRETSHPYGTDYSRYNPYLDDNREEVKKFGGDSDEDKYIKQKADSVIQTALHKSRTRKNVEVPLFDDPEYDKKLQAAYEVMITAQNDTRDPFARDILKDMFGTEGPSKAKIANAMADRYYKLLRHPNKSVGATCMYNASDCYGKEHRVPGNQTFKENPKKYGFNKIPIKDAKEGDLVQVTNKYDGVPNHAMIINDASNPDSLTFNYVDGGDEERNIKINAKYPIDDMYTYDAYRFVGSPQDSVKWKNEYHRLNKKRLGGNMKHKLVEVNIGGNSKLIRVVKPSSTGESERSEGLTRKRAAIGTKTRKLEDGTVVPVYDSIINSIDTPNTIKYINENLTPKPSLSRINPTEIKSNLPEVKLNGRQKLYKAAGNIINTPNLISDVIGVGSNIIGSLITKRINNKALDSLTFQKPPVALVPSKLKTKININPQLDKMRESLADYERLISGNTASSRVALGRINRVRSQGIANTNQLYGQKENIETQLINQDTMNQQRVLDRNLQQDYQYRAAKNAFENEVRNLKAENKVANVQNIVTGIQDLLTRREQRKMFNKTLTAETLANPNLPAEMYLKDGIWSKELYDMYRSQYPRKA